MKFLLKRNAQASYCNNADETTPTYAIKTLIQVMKISLIVLITVCASALTLLAHTSDAQALKEVKISIDVKNQPLADVLNQIEKLTSFHFVYPSIQVKDQQVKKLSV